jgi:AhpD family alkylhydroperoxidase
MKSTLRDKEAAMGAMESTVKQRMKNPVFMLPEAMKALLSLGKASSNGGVAPIILALVHLRASQINGCSACVYDHSRELKKAGVTDERIFALAAWRDSPFFADAERAALALTEAVTRLSDRSNAVPDEVWEEAVRHFNERELADLILHIAQINLWNRINVTVRQAPGGRDGGQS